MTESIWLSQKYLLLLSNRLRNFKQKSPNLFNFACPFCGDSTDNPKAARGYVYYKSGRLRFHCHKCNTPKTSIENLIEYVDSGLYKEYVREKLFEKGGLRKDQVEETKWDFTPKKFIIDSQLRHLRKVSQLDNDHIAKRYVLDRKIPTKYHAKLFFAPKFMEWTNTIVPGKFDKAALRHEDARIVIPFINKTGDMHAYQGRALGESDVKYIAIVTDETQPKVWGLDGVDLKSRYYAFEGPIDAMFLPNAVAVAGGDLNALNKLDTTNAVVVYDNEPRSSNAIKKIDKAINLGYNVCIWPDSIVEKDVNEMCLAGHSQDYIKQIIDQNTFSGLSAKMALSKWNKTETKLHA